MQGCEILLVGEDAGPARGCHMAGLAGTDFFSVEVLTWRGLVTYYVLFFLHLQTRRVTLAGITRHPTEEWVTQIARNAIDEESGCLRQHQYVLHDRDTKFCAEFRETLAARGVHTCASTVPFPWLREASRGTISDRAA